MRQQLAELGLTTPWAIWKALRNFFVTIWDPTRSDIQGGVNTLIYRGLQETPPEQVRELEDRHPELVELFRAGYDPDITPARLEKLPEGSLGREYARFIRENGIDPLATLLELDQPKTTLEYVFRRAYKLHDIMHVVLGADASVLGEVRIVSYSIGQSRGGPGRAPALALAVLFMNIALRRVHEMPEAIRLAATWMAVGEQTLWHPAFRVEDHFEKPVEEVRERMLGEAFPA